MGEGDFKLNQTHKMIRSIVRFFGGSYVTLTDYGGEETVCRVVYCGCGRKLAHRRPFGIRTVELLKGGGCIDVETGEPCYVKKWREWPDTCSTVRSQVNALEKRVSDIEAKQAVTTGKGKVRK